jgi:hypothetical protein
LPLLALLFFDDEPLAFALSMKALGVDVVVDGRGDVGDFIDLAGVGDGVTASLLRSPPTASLLLLLLVDAPNRHRHAPHWAGAMVMIERARCG